MRSMLTATLISWPRRRPPRRRRRRRPPPAPSRSRWRPFRSGRRCRPRPIPPMRWRRRERLAIQSDLAWVGQYNGAITGEVSERMVAAIKEFQKERGGKQTGVLNPQERGVLAETAKRRQDNVGWKIVTDRRHRRAARRADQTGAAAIQRRQRRQMEFPHRHHPDSAGAAQGSQPHHRETRRAGKEGAGRAQDRLHRGQAGFLRAVGHAGPEEILSCAARSRATRSASSPSSTIRPPKAPWSRW